MISDEEAERRRRSLISGGGGMPMGGSRNGNGNGNGIGPAVGLNPIQARGQSVLQQQAQAQQMQQRPQTQAQAQQRPQPQQQQQQAQAQAHQMQMQQQAQAQRTNRYQQPQRPTYQQPWRPANTTTNATAHPRQPQQYGRYHQPPAQGQGQRPAPYPIPVQGNGYNPNNNNFQGIPNGNAAPQETARSVASSCGAPVIQTLSTKKRRVRSVLFLAALAFVGMLVLDGFVQFTDLSQRVDKTVRDGVENAVNAADSLERRLVDELRPDQQQNYKERKGDEPVGMAGRFLRRLADYLLDDDEAAPPHRSYSSDNTGDGSSRIAASLNNEGLGADTNTIDVHTVWEPPRMLHTLPLLPKHALQHRQRRELMENRLPIPEHLQEGHEDEMYHADNAHRRRRMYPVLKDEEGKEVVDARMLQDATENQGEGDGDAAGIEMQQYETGALYQGYGTHYVDLWVGTPPQRQTVIIDTGSSVTAFPCTGCNSCGTNPATGKQYHLDDDFDTAMSKTYQEKTCQNGSQCDLGRCTRVTISGEDHTSEHCQMAVSYAEGSSWTALEGSDVVYPAGPHEEGLWTKDDRLGAGIGAGMGTLGAEKKFDWMDFKMKFGCQTKVTGLFRTQLEDGIMGMDNRNGAFWLQLHNHYKWHYEHNGYTPSEEDKALFDSTQFSLCYDRQPLSMDLKPGVGSGALTLGGTDPLLHNTDMVFAKSLASGGGWYSVRVKAMFLKTGGGSLSEPPQDEKGGEYVRVDAFEHVLNGNENKGKGLIVDSGTTDTYLPQNLHGSFDEAWKKVVGAESKFHNNLQELTPEQVKSLPTILFVLEGHSSNNKENAIGMTSSHQAMFNTEGVKAEAVSKSDVVVAMPSTHYMEESHKQPGMYSARIYFTERYGSQSILGSNFMMGHEVNFDVGGGRIGFAESHCDYSRYLEQRNAKLQQQIEQELQQEEGGGDATARVAQTEEANGNEAHNIEGDLAASGWARD